MPNPAPCYHLDVQNRAFENSPFLLILANRVSLFRQYQHSQPKAAEIFKACPFNLGLLFCFNTWNVCGCCSKVCTLWNKITSYNTEVWLRQCSETAFLTLSFHPTLLHNFTACRFSQNPLQQKINIYFSWPVTSKLMSLGYRIFPGQMRKRGLDIFFVN